MKKSVAVLGLGKFGSSVARALTKGGAEAVSYTHLRAHETL